MNAAKDNFYFLAGFWQALLPIDFKSIVLRAVVTGALMSGIEAEVLNKTQLDEIESNHMTLMRKATGSLSSYNSNGIRKQQGNTHIRELMGINHTTREIPKRRIKWYKEILTNNEDNKQLRGAVFGRLDKEEEIGSINVGI